VNSMRGQWGRRLPVSAPVGREGFVWVPLSPPPFLKIPIIMGLRGGRRCKYDITKELFAEIRKQRTYTDLVRMDGGSIVVGDRGCEPRKMRWRIHRVRPKTQGRGTQGLCVVDVHGFHPWPFSSFPCGTRFTEKEKRTKMEPLISFE
jgi:hypothetical protein